MNDPTTQHNVCPACHTHQVVDRGTGLFVPHHTVDPTVTCIGSGRPPHMTAADVRYAPGSQYESCPAATGEARIGTPCTHFPDTAHRCAEERSHVRSAIVHRCTCGYGWISSSAP